VRLLLLLPLLLATSVARADEPGIVAPSTEEPGLQRAPAAPSGARGFWKPRERGPRLKFSYRTFSIGEMANRDARYHCFGVDAYIYSGYLRTGAGLEAGFEDSQRDNFIASGVINVGAQYPTRITPFLDLTIGLGLLRRDVLEQDLVDFAYSVGIDGGVEVFVGAGLLVSVGIGWRRQLFRHDGNDQVEPIYVYFDSFTAKVGFGF